MAIISTIGRRSVKVRVLIGAIYLTLIVGAFTMVYPFMLMIAGTTKSGVDTPESEVIPSFLRSDLALYRKTMEGYFNELLSNMQVSFDEKTISFRKCEPPKTVNDKSVAAWIDFQKQAHLPFYTYELSFVDTPVSKNSVPLNLRKFKNQLYKKYKGNIELMNRELGTEFVKWSSFKVYPEIYLMRRFMPGTNKIHLTYREFKEKQPMDYRFYFCPEGFYKMSFLMPIYTKHIDAYNKAHKTSYKSWSDIHLTRTYPKGKQYTAKERKDWEEYVRTIVNILWLRADKKAQPIYQTYLKEKYKTIAALNGKYETKYKSFNEIPIIETPPFSGLVLSDWNAFIQGWKDPASGTTHMLPIEMVKIHSVEFMYRDYLKEKYGSIEKVNAALGTGYSNWLSIFPPQKEANYKWFKANAGDLKWEFIKRNYIAVTDYIVLHGRGILNTAIYCSLSILCALLVNPIAAYALSRYKPPSAYKILLFLMMTMAFPPMVTQIPVFLMLREFQLLNTFAALLLPALANGYSIFLLKGFFDSLPHELYEVAEIDGASEFYIFTKVTMSLSKPILAVIALQSFTHAYANFMMALLICQDEKMWTLMPWLYQLQQRSCQGVVFTSLIIAAIPTFIIFALCQNVIMRGIVVPVEK